MSNPVAGGGDFDADGVPDILSAGSGSGYYGHNKWVWEGAGGGAGFAEWTDDGPTWSGDTVASRGEVDGDGCDDLASGWGLAPGWDAYYDPADYTWGVDVYDGATCPVT